LGISDVDIVGSVANKGVSEHDLDLLAHSKESSDKLREALPIRGFEWMGSNNISPQEVAQYQGNKYFQKDVWTIIDQYKNTSTGHKIEVWHIENRK